MEDCESEQKIGDCGGKEKTERNRERTEEIALRKMDKLRRKLGTQ